MNQVLLITLSCLLTTSVIIENVSPSTSASDSGSALSESGSLMTFPCYIQNCASCPVSPFICENCSNPLSCCSRFCADCSGNTCNACFNGFTLTDNFCVSQSPCSKISVACTQCSGQSCTGCYPGFYVSTQINQCLPCPDQCVHCVSETNCTSCQSGYFLNGVVCSACSSPCLTCANSSLTCLSCAQGSMLLHDTCISCGSNCYSCNTTSPNDAICAECVSGYFLDTSSASKPQCSACPIFCTECSSSTSCNNCAQGTFYNGGNCQMCPQHCSSCLEGGSICLSCFQNYFISLIVGNSKCVPCLIANCIECASSTECIICVDGYTSIAGVCMSCNQLVNHCQNCSIQAATQQQTCTICQVNYFLSNNTCLPCPAFCGQCTNQTFCTFCWFGYKTNMATGECTPGYPMCLYNPGATQCQGCGPGYFFHQSYCVACTVSNCLYCTGNPLSSVLQSTCTQCHSNFYLQAGLCNPCNQNLNCLQCEDNSTCSQCGSGSYLTADGKCQYCYGCAQCVLVPQVGQAQCTQCFANNYLGYYLSVDYQVCVGCYVDNCLYCQLTNYDPSSMQITTKCLVCIQGAIMVNQSCILCGPNCQKCTSNITCQQCFATYGLINGSCINCNTGCGNCDGEQSNCTSCYSGYCLNSSNNSCFSCGSINNNCSQYYINNANISICSACNTGFYLVNGSCSQCSALCSSCAIDADSCNNCVDGYYLTYERQCAVCMGQCSTCSSQLLCTGCDEGAYLQEGRCLDCPNGCFACMNSNNCYSCLGPYYYTQVNATGTCNACSDDCASCLDQSQCLDCLSAYYLNNQSQCEPCTANCLNCTDGSTCDSCADGYQLEGNDCTADDNGGNGAGGFPWWAIMLIVIGVVVLIVALGLAVKHFRGKEKNTGSYMELSAEQTNNK